ncbi:FprA family A-type flavoprotein [Parabacteroides sp. Marseille-P3160]|uniref:FprA family A-type flavoprotein n=1 Tax=Parabacteroides sp. Marseille-P3160 TaxID=1917887 RepID=UPI0009B945D5|nr:FprA family A-type flavoprotein [Parabacteroides sp. Marseille-P3160]
MYKLKEITDKVYYVGVNDRTKERFENLWPLPHGVSYNSYLIMDEKTVLIDTVDICYSDIFLKKVADALGGRKLDYLVVDHMEPDHAGSIRLLKEEHPDLKIVGNKIAFGMLDGYHGIKDGLHEVKDGDTLSIGSRELKFFMAPMVHWPEVMFTYDMKEKTLFSADAFGTYGTLDGGIIDSEINLQRFWGEMIRYYSNIIGKYGMPVQKVLGKLAGVEIKTICSTHGPVWREHVQQAVGLYDRLSRYEGEEGVTIIYGTMYGHTEQMADAIAFGLAENGIKNIAMHNVSNVHASYILRDVFKYKGLVVGSPTYSNQLFPPIDALLHQMELREIKNRYVGYFGSFSWAGAAVKRLAAFQEKIGWEQVGSPVEQKQGMKESIYEACIALGAEMAGKLKNN